MAARKLIKHSLSDGVELGLVQFDDIAEQLTPMVTLTDNNRGYLADKVPSMYDGGTSIGAGLEEALEVSESSIVFKLSKGNKNCSHDQLIAGAELHFSCFISNQPWLLLKTKKHKLNYSRH